MLLSYKPLHLEDQQRLQEEGCVVDIIILEGVKMLMMITTNLVERLHEEANKQKLHQGKGLMQRKIIGTTDTIETRIQVCCSRRNDMTTKIDAS